ncbi:hypothetical protein D1157_13280 [Anaerotruncus sp. X29]|nr:hypothetical protein [Anaerotruncus sp. X29]
MYGFGHSVPAKPFCCCAYYNGIFLKIQLLSRNLFETGMAGRPSGGFHVRGMFSTGNRTCCEKFVRCFSVMGCCTGRTICREEREKCVEFAGMIC